MRKTKQTFMKSLIAILLVWATASNAEFFQPSEGQLYRIESQFSGNLVTGYLYTLYMNHYTNNDTIRYWRFEPAGEPGVYFIRRNTDTGTIRSPNAPGARAEFEYISTPTSDRYKWRIEKVLLPGGRDTGFYTIRSVYNGLYLSQYIDMTAGNLRAETGEPRAVSQVTGRTEYWAIEPVVVSPIEVLAVPQGGWNPDALNKCAILSSTNDLGGSVSYTVTGTPSPITGNAIYWGQYWNNQYFYIINLNQDELRVPGTYTLEANGKQATIRIVDDAYTRPYRQKGADRFSIADVFDDDYGFVGHWGRLATWWDKGLASAPTNEFMWRDWGDNNNNGKDMEAFDPSRPLTDEIMTKAYSGGWDMTDQNWNEWMADGNVLHDMVRLYQATTDAVVRAQIEEEIVYGVNGLLINQEPNGRWRQGVVEGSYWLGTMAARGGGLASTYAILEQDNPTLAAQVLEGASNAWSYVYANRNDTTQWAIPGEGVMPDGTTMTHKPQTHRHAYAAEFLEFAVDYYLLTGSSEAKAVVDDFLARGAIDSSGRLYHTYGAKFPGEQTIRDSMRAIVAGLKYYDSASVAQQSTILSWCRSYYANKVISSYDLDGPSGMFEADILGSGTGGQWAMPPRMMVAALIYDRFGDEFARGMIVGQRAIDYWTGCNPYATSLLLGIGDEFQVSGWSSYQALGRHVGLISTTYTDKKLESSTGSFMSKETTANGGVQVWLAWQLFQNRIADLEKHSVQLYSGNNYTGTRAFLPAGSYQEKHLKAYGIANTIGSVKVPEGLQVTLSSGTYSSDTPTLSASASSATVVAEAPTARISTPTAGSTVPPAPLTLTGSASDPQDGVLSGSSLVWSSDIDGVLGTGNRISATLSPGNHTITLTATDSSGQTGTAETTLAVEVYPGIKMAVRGKGRSIENGATAVSAQNGTLFEPLEMGHTLYRTYEIANVGSEDLTVQTVTVSGTGFSVVVPPESPVPSGESTTFSVRFEPQSPAEAAGTVSFSSNDPDAATFSFAIAARNFTPLSLPGCIMWLDGTDVDGDGVAEGLAESGLNGGAVATWTDKSGSSHSATQASATQQPHLVENQLNGNAVVHFDGSDDTMDFPELSTIRTVFWVVKENVNASTTPRFLLGHSSKYDFHRGEHASPNTIWSSSYASPYIKNGTTRLDDGVVNGTVTALPQGHFIRLSVVATGNVSANRLTQDRSFARFWDGDIAELLIYDSALSDSDREAVETYLRNKWFVANQPPEFVADPIEKVQALEGSAYGETLDGSATDPDSNTLSYAKSSGPGWLSVAPDGTLGGTPGTADAGRTNRWVVEVSDGNGGTAHAVLAIEVQLSPQGYYNAWLEGYPGIGSATNWNDNPDGDNLENLAEYALGGDPLVPDTGNPSTFRMLETSGSNVLEYVYAKRNDAEQRGLAYSLGSTPDLVSGAWSNANAEVVGTGVLDAEFDTVTNRIPADGEAGFIRLEIGH